MFTIFLKHSCLLKCDESSCSLGAKRDSSPDPIKTWAKSIWLLLIQLGSFGRVSDIQCTDSSSEWLWNLMFWKEMHLFAYEILSKFQAFELKHRYEDKFVRCICMVSANYMEFVFLFLWGFLELQGIYIFLTLRIYWNYILRTRFSLSVLVATTRLSKFLLLKTSHARLLHLLCTDSKAS